MRLPQRRYALVWLAVPLSVVFGAAAAAGIPPYDDYVQVQDAIIDSTRQKLDINLNVAAGNEVTVNNQVVSLACELEAQRRGEIPRITLGEADAELREIVDLAAQITNPENGAVFGQARFKVAYTFHRYRSMHATGDWSSATRDAVHSMIKNAKWALRPSGNLGNLELPIAGARLLVGEAYPDPDLFEEGADLLQLMADRLARLGSGEPTSPHYAAHSWRDLVLLTGLEDPWAHHLVSGLLAYTQLMSAHLYLPGGGMGSPQTRASRAGGSFIVDPDPTKSQHLAGHLKLLVGDPDLIASVPASLAITDYVMPELIRSVFLDKGGGYEFRTRHDAFGNPNAGGTLRYPVGWRDLPTVPWHAVTVAGGTAQMGIMYGATNTNSQDASMGVYLKVPPASQPPEPGKGFSILAHLHPTLSPLSVDRYRHERSTYRRFLFGHTLIQLWDANLDGDRLLTLMHIPLFTDPGQGDAYLEVSSGSGNPWRIGQSGNAYVAILPLGAITAEELVEPTDGTLSYTQLQLEARSGSVIELATTDDFADIETYGLELAGRSVQFTNTGGDLTAVVEDRHGTAIGLDYTTDSRSLDGAPVSHEYLRSGVMSSPFVSWDEPSFTLSISRPGYGDPLTFVLGDPARPSAAREARSLGQRIPSDPVHLVWQEAWDDGAIDHYEIWMRGATGDRLVVDGLTTTSGTYSPIDDGVTADETVSFYVIAVDDTGRSSRKSNRINNVEVGPLDITDPTTPANLSVTPLGPFMIVSWDASTDVRGVELYRIYRDTVEVGQTSDLRFDDSEGLVPGTEYTYTVVAEDATGNQSASPAPVTKTTSAEFNPPTAVMIFGSAVGARNFIHWPTPSSDDTGINSYLIYRDGVFHAFSSPNNQHWWDNNVAPGQTYSYTVYVWDTYGNASEASNTVEVVR